METAYKLWDCDEASFVLDEDMEEVEFKNWPAARDFATKFAKEMIEEENLESMKIAILQVMQVEELEFKKDDVSGV